MNNSHTDLPHRKRFRDENPASLSSPEHNNNKKRSKNKNKNKGQDALIPQDPLPSTKPNEKGAEQNEQLHLCPNPDPVTLEKEQGAEPNGVTAEHPVSDSTPRKKKRKKKKNKDVALASSEGEQPNSLQLESEQRNAKENGAESCEVKVRAVQPQVCHKLEVVNPVVQENENFVELKVTSAEQPQLCNKQKHELAKKVVEPSKENGVGKNEGAAEYPGLVPVPDSVPSKDIPRKKKLEKKKMIVLSGEGEEPNGSNNAEHPQVCYKPESASPIHTQHVIPMGPEVLTDPEQKLSKKKRRKKKRKNSALNNEVAEPAKHNGELPEIPVQRCPITASQTDQKLSTDSAIPIDQEQKKSKKKKRRKKKSALKSEGSESDKHNTESTAEIPVSEDNVEQPANAPLRRSERLKGNKAPRHGPGHKFKDCPDSKEICFFCGKIGHSLAKCSVSQAGGRFAWCLFCYSHGHFTNKCPRNGHGINPKVVAGNGPVHKTVEA